MAEIFHSGSLTTLHTVLKSNCGKPSELQKNHSDNQKECVDVSYLSQEWKCLIFKMIWVKSLRLNGWDVALWVTDDPWIIKSMFGKTSDLL